MTKHSDALAPDHIKRIHEEGNQRRALYASGFRRNDCLVKKRRHRGGRGYHEGNQPVQLELSIALKGRPR